MTRIKTEHAGLSAPSAKSAVNALATRMLLHRRQSDLHGRVRPRARKAHRVASTFDGHFDRRAVTALRAFRLPLRRLSGALRHEHGYHAEFRPWLGGTRLHVPVIREFPAGRRIET